MLLPLEILKEEQIKSTTRKQREIIKLESHEIEKRSKTEIIKEISLVFGEYG